MLGISRFFSFCCCVLFACTGKQPTKGEHLKAIIAAKDTGPRGQYAKLKLKKDHCAMVTSWALGVADPLYPSVKECTAAAPLFHEAHNENLLRPAKFDTKDTIKQLNKFCLNHLRNAVVNRPFTTKFTPTPKELQQFRRDLGLQASEDDRFVTIFTEFMDTYRAAH